MAQSSGGRPSSAQNSVHPAAEKQVVKQKPKEEKNVRLLGIAFFQGFVLKKCIFFLNFIFEQRHFFCEFDLGI